MFGLGVVFVLAGLVGWGWVLSSVAVSTSTVLGGPGSFAGMVALGGLSGFLSTLAIGAAALFVAGVALIAADKVRSSVLQRLSAASPSTEPSAAAPSVAAPSGAARPWELVGLAVFLLGLGGAVVYLVGASFR